MTDTANQPLLLEDYDVLPPKSRWEHFQILSKNISKNINWTMTVSAFVLIVTLATITSSLLTHHINQYLGSPQFDHYGIYNLIKSINI